MTFPRFYTLWAINAPLDERRLRRQLDAMRAFGFDGTVFHPRFYPGDPLYLSDEYMAVLSRTILYGKSIGMEFWIYDEDGWPSGTVGGQLLREHPEDRQQWADLVTELPPNEECLASFQSESRRWHVVRRYGNGVDYLNPALAGHFIEMTHERYRTGLDPAAFEYVSTFFSDEPEFGLGHAYDLLSGNGSIPWTGRLPELYQQRYGESLAAALPGIFLPIDGQESTRVRFWELLTDLFCDAFISPVDQWCRSHGKRLAAHVKGEEHPLFQVPTHGSAHRVFRRLSLPGIDALGRDRSNDFFPRQLASAARQFGDGRSMVECFGGAGWGATPDAFRSYLLWLGGHGITDFVVHLWQYRLNSHAIRDWPASIPNHIGWSDAFPQLLRQLKPDMAAAVRLSGVDEADTLLISPHRAIMELFLPVELRSMNIHDARTYADTPASRINYRFMAIVAREQGLGTAYHIADERTFEEGTIDGNRLRIGQWSYKRVLLPSDCAFNSPGHDLVARLIKAGITVDRSTVPPAEEASSRRTAPEDASLSSLVPISWSVVPPPNDLPLEPVAIDAAGNYRATFTVESELINLSVVFADKIERVAVNGHGLALVETEDGSTAHVPNLVLVAGHNVITFQSGSRMDDMQARPLIWIHGNFRALSESVFVIGANGTVSTRGPWFLRRAAIDREHDLTLAGYPFVRRPVKATSTIILPERRSILRFIGIAADAARVEIDAVCCGFAWEPDWSIDIPQSIGAGVHSLGLTLYPSAYNSFGPHHHFDGDIHVVSPVQFEGRKNFADRVDAPSGTFVPAWHVKPLRLPGGIVLLEANEKRPMSKV